MTRLDDELVIRLFYFSTLSRVIFTPMKSITSLPSWSVNINVAGDIVTVAIDEQRSGKQIQ